MELELVLGGAGRGPLCLESRECAGEGGLAGEQSTFPVERWAWAQAGAHWDSLKFASSLGLHTHTCGSSHLTKAAHLMENFPEPPVVRWVTIPFPAGPQPLCQLCAVFSRWEQIRYSQR